MDRRNRFRKRIPTWGLDPGRTVEIVKGIAADVSDRRLYLTTPKLLAAFDLTTDKMGWQKSYPGGCDRLAISPDGKTLYVRSFESKYWNVIRALNGDLIARLEPNSGSHNAIWSPDGTRV